GSKRSALCSIEPAHVPSRAVSSKVRSSLAVPASISSTRATRQGRSSSGSGTSTSDSMAWKNGTRARARARATASTRRSDERPGERQRPAATPGALDRRAGAVGGESEVRYSLETLPGGRKPLVRAPFPLSEGEVRDLKSRRRELLPPQQGRQLAQEQGQRPG